MPRRSDNSLIPQTCPKIDSVLSIITDIYSADEPITKGELQNIEKLMEEIREANSKLRDWGNDEYNRAEELEKDKDYYQNEHEKAQSEVDSLKSEVDSLKSEIKDLEKELQNT